MKTSLKKWLNPHLHLKPNSKFSRNIQPLAQFHDLNNASQAMEDMRDCYDSLLSAAAAATNSAFEFSESLREMGVCLLQKIALNDDEESGKVMLMLGKAQFELQKIVDVYRNHIFQTITVPSESFINELHTVEEMKHQCDEKREVYEYMKTKCSEKGRYKTGKGETFSLQQLHEAKNEFDEEATLLAFRLKSLKQGQSRSLLTQATRHHSAQLSFFKKGLKSLEAVDPQVKLVTQQQHIDHQLIDQEDEETEDVEDDDESDDDDYSSTSSDEDNKDSKNNYQNNDRQLSFVSTATHPMEENLKSSQGDYIIRQQKMLSQSAPIFPQQKFDPNERIGQLRPSASRKFLSYALPKPGETKSILAGSENPIPQTKSNPLQSENHYHSSPLEPNSYSKLVGMGNLSEPLNLNSKSVLKESNNNRIPPPLTESFLKIQHKPQITSNSEKPKLQSFSGPLTSQRLSTKPSLSTGHPVVSSNILKYSSGPILRGSAHQASTSLKISELHELPRPPLHLSSGKPSGMVGFSGPLVLKKPESSITGKMPVPKIASPLPTPPRVGYVSMPLTSTGITTKSSHSGPSETSPDYRKSEDILAPPLSSTALANQHQERVD